MWPCPGVQCLGLSQTDWGRPCRAYQANGAFWRRWPGRKKAGWARISSILSLLGGLSMFLNEIHILVFLIINFSIKCVKFQPRKKTFLPLPLPPPLLLSLYIDIHNRNIASQARQTHRCAAPRSSSTIATWSTHIQQRCQKCQLTSLIFFVRRCKKGYVWFSKLHNFSEINYLKILI